MNRDFNNEQSTLFHSGWNACVYEVEDIGSDFPKLRRVRLVGESIRLLNWVPGESIKVLIGERYVETCTPASIGERGMWLDILFFLDDDSPLSVWASRTGFGEIVSILPDSMDSKTPWFEA